eukprot:2658817-Prorocentrum_lima.AAC.1
MKTLTACAGIGSATVTKSIDKLLGMTIDGTILGPEDPNDDVEDLFALQFFVHKDGFANSEPTTCCLPEVRLACRQKTCKGVPWERSSRTWGHSASQI